MFDAMDDNYHKPMSDEKTDVRIQPGAACRAPQDRPCFTQAQQERDEARREVERLRGQMDEVRRKTLEEAAKAMCRFCAGSVSLISPKIEKLQQHGSFHRYTHEAVRPGAYACACEASAIRALEQSGGPL